MMVAVVEVKQKKLGGDGEEYVSCFRKTAAEERKQKHSVPKLKSEMTYRKLFQNAESNQRVKRKHRVGWKAL